MYYVPLRGARATSEGVTSYERQRVIRGGRQLADIFGCDHADVVNNVGSRSKAGAAGVIPLKLDGVAKSYTLKRLKPTVAVAGEFQVARPSQGSAAEEPRGTKRQRADPKCCD